MAPLPSAVSFVVGQRRAVESQDLSTASIPDPVRAFIAEHIRSVMELEMLLALCCNPDKAWTSDELSKEMRVEAAWAGAALGELTRRRLLKTEGTPGETSGAAPTRYRYAPASPAVDETIRQLAQTYADLRVSVIEFIFSLPEDPIRNFADAFRFRKERPGG